MCLDRPGGSPDLLIETADGAFWNGSDYPSTGGTCMGDPSNGTGGVIAANAAEAESMCGMGYDNLRASLPAGTTPLPPATWWNCIASD